MQSPHVRLEESGSSFVRRGRSPRIQVDDLVPTRVDEPATARPTPGACCSRGSRSPPRPLNSGVRVPADDGVLVERAELVEARPVMILL